MDSRGFPSEGVEFGGDELTELIIRYGWACHLIGGMSNLDGALIREVERKVWDIYYQEERQLAQFIVDVLTKGVLDRARDEFPPEQDIAQGILKQIVQPDNGGYSVGAF